MRRILTLARLLITLLVTSVSASLCHASVEPELTTAVRHKDLRQVQLLLSEGADVNERDEGLQQTPLMRATQMGDAAIVRVLLAHKAQVNAQDDAGQTALMFAVQKGNIQIARILMGYGADSSMTDTVGATALTIAQKRGYGSLSRLLRTQIVRQNRSRHPAANSTTSNPYQRRPDTSAAYLASGSPPIIQVGHRRVMSCLLQL
jgi:ankyrin repeat protein